MSARYVSGQERGKDYKDNPREPRIEFEFARMVHSLSLDAAARFRDELTQALRTPRCVDCGEVKGDADWPMVTAENDSCCEDWCCWHCHGLRMRKEARCSPV